MEKGISEGLHNLGCLSNTAGIIELRRMGGCGKFGPRLGNDIKAEPKAIECKVIH